MSVVGSVLTSDLSSEGSVGSGLSWLKAAPEWLVLLANDEARSKARSPDSAAFFWFLGKVKAGAGVRVDGTREHIFIRVDKAGRSSEVTVALDESLGCAKIEAVQSCAPEWSPFMLPRLPWCICQSLDWMFEARRIFESNPSMTWSEAQLSILHKRFGPVVDTAQGTKTSRRPLLGLGLLWFDWDGKFFW